MLPSENQDSRSQKDDQIGHAAQALTESSSSVHISQALALPSTEVANSLMKGPRSNLQLTYCTSGGSNLVPNSSEHTTWDTGASGEISQAFDSLPDPTEINNVPNGNNSLWPLYIADTDWGIDFDVPLTAEASTTPTTAESTAPTDLEWSLSSVQSIPNFDAARCPRELVEFLGANEKVCVHTKLCPCGSTLVELLMTLDRSARHRHLWVSKLSGSQRKTLKINGLQDPVPSIDFSLRAVFLAQNRMLGNLSSAKQQEIDQIFKRMSSIQTSSLMDSSDEQWRDGYTRWYDDDLALMETCKTGMFRIAEFSAADTSGFPLTVNSVLSEICRVIMIFIHGLLRKLRKTASRTS